MMAKTTGEDVIRDMLYRLNVNSQSELKSKLDGLETTVGFLKGALSLSDDDLERIKVLISENQKKGDASMRVLFMQLKASIMGILNEAKERGEKKTEGKKEKGRQEKR